MRKFFTTAVLVLAVLCSGLNAQVFTETFSSVAAFTAWNQTVIAPGVNNTTNKFQRFTTMRTNGFGIPTLASATAANGWITLDSDGGCGGDQHVRIESPVIDCSTLPVVELKFEQWYRRFFDTTFVEVSVNGGPWQSFTPNVAYTYPQSPASTNPEVVTLNISSAAANQANVRIGFRFKSIQSMSTQAGCGYAWHIDDVEVRAGSPINTTLDNYVATQPSLYTPLGQIVSIPFLAKSTNRGTGPSTHQIGVTVTEGIGTTGTVVHTTSSNITALAAGSSDTSLIGSPYTPVTASVHQVTYELTLAGNAAGVQRRQIPFFATQNFFSKDNGVPSGLTLLGSDIPSAGGGTFNQTKVANHYYVPNATDPSGASWVATSVTFACYGGLSGGTGGDLSGKTFNVFLSKWDDANTDFFVDDAELTIIATGSETMPTPFTPDSVYFFSTQLYDLITNGNSRLDANSNYLVGVEYTEPYSTAELAYLVRGTAHNTEPMEDATYKASLQTRIQWGSCLFQAPNWFEGVTALRTGPAMIDLSLDLEVGVRELANFKGELNIAPNPATTYFVANLKMDAEESFVEYVVMDMAGRVIFTKRHENVKEEQVTFSVNELPAGSYNLTVRTQNGQNNKKFIVVK